MSFFKQLQSSCFFALVSLASLSATGYVSTLHSCEADVEHAQDHFGTASYLTRPGYWYTLETNAYPQVAALSQGRNKGIAEGGIELSATGFTIQEGGNYWVTVTAILQNPSEEFPVLVPVYLVLNETFDPDDVSPIGGVITLESGKIDTVHGTGTLKNVAPGTRVSIVATHVGYPFPVTLAVLSWSISLFKIP